MSESRTSAAARIGAAVSVVLLGLVLTLGGCADEERKLLDVETPGMDVEVRENVDTGEITIDGDLNDGHENNSEEQR